MLITKYLIKEIFKIQIIILFFLLLIFFFQKLISTLNNTKFEMIPIFLITILLLLSITEILKLIFPLSIFLSVLIGLHRLYSSNEIIIIYTFGISKLILIKSVIILTFFTAIFSMLNVFWFSPWSLQYQDLLIKNFKSNLDYLILEENTLYFFKDKRIVFFFDKMEKKNFLNLFLGDLTLNKYKKPFFIFSKKGKFQSFKDDLKIFNLYYGKKFENINNSKNFNITYFDKYKKVLKIKLINIKNKYFEKLTFFELLNLKKNQNIKNEIYWRIILIFSNFIMGLIVIPFSTIKINPKKIFLFVPLIFLYIIYFLLHGILKSNGLQKLNTFNWIIFINLIYIKILTILNFKGTYFIRTLYIKLKRIKNYVHFR